MIMTDHSSLRIIFFNSYYFIYLSRVLIIDDSIIITITRINIITSTINILVGGILLSKKFLKNDKIPELENF